MQGLSQLATDRVRQLGQAQADTGRVGDAATTSTDRIHRDSSFRDSSNLETPEATNRWDEANLPEWLWPYVQCRSWAIRFASLLNQGYFPELHDLAAHIAKTAHTNPVHMMAKSCSKVQWETSMQQARERMSVERTSAEVRSRLGLTKATVKQVKAIYAAVWRLKGHVMRYAATAQEVGRDRYKFFCWLTSKANLAREVAYYARPYAT